MSESSTEAIALLGLKWDKPKVTLWGYEATASTGKHRASFGLSFPMAIAEGFPESDDALMFCLNQAIRTLLLDIVPRGNASEAPNA